jgi:hypothetical protein
MCRGGRLVADFVAGTDTPPDLPGELSKHLTATVDGLWVVWAYKLARPAGDQFIPLTQGAAYPADARAECRAWGSQGTHRAPDPQCACGFHALSSQRLPGLPVGGDFAALSVALSGRVLAFEWEGEGVLWRAERQTVVRVDRPARLDPVEEIRRVPRRPDDPDGRLALRPAATPFDSGPVRLSLPASSPVLVACHDDAGWCAAPSPPSPSSRPSAALVLA